MKPCNQSQLTYFALVLDKIWCRRKGQGNCNIHILQCSSLCCVWVISSIRMFSSLMICSTKYLDRLGFYQMTLCIPEKELRPERSISEWLLSVIETNVMHGWCEVQYRNAVPWVFFFPLIQIQNQAHWHLYVKVFNFECNPWIFLHQIIL